MMETMPSGQDGAGQDGAGRGALATLALAMLLPSLAISIANVGLPVLAAAFGASFQDAQWVVLAYLLAVTTLIVGVGRLGDLVGRRRLLLFGVALFTAASLLCGVAPSLWWLLAARAGQGLGAAVMMALAMAFVGGTVPKARIGRAMGLLGTMSAVGTALGPSLGGVLIDGVGWRSIFLVNAPLGVLAFVLAWRWLPADSRSGQGSRAGFDVTGTLLLAGTLAAYALAMTLGRGQFGTLNIALVAAALAGLWLFLRVERRTAAPLIALAAFRDRRLSRGLVAGGLVTTVLMATMVVGPFHLAHGLGLDAAAVGLAMSAGPLAAALTGVPAGRAVDRFGAQRMTVAGLCGVEAGCVVLAAMPAAAGVAGYLAGLVVLTAGYALFQTANNTAVMAGIGPERRGVTSGLLNLARHLGLVTGASVMGAVFAAGAGAADLATALPDAVATGMRVTFGVGALLIAAAVAVASRDPAVAKERCAL